MTTPKFSGFGPSFRGSVPTLITPFDDSGAIDWPAVDLLVDYHIASGCVGIFSPCLSSEMFDLSAQERIDLASRVKQRAVGRCAVVSTGTYGGSVEEMAAEVNAIAPFCDAVVIVTAFLAKVDEDESAWLANAQRLVELTPGVKLGTYECPVPYKRLLSPEAMRWLASSGRFHFHKDTCCNMTEIKAKLAAVSTSDSGLSFSFFNANVETLLDSLDAGAAGFSGISANFYPHLHVWLCAASHAKAPLPRADLQHVQDFLSLAEATVCVAYPHSAKAYLGLYSSMLGRNQPNSPCGKKVRKPELKGVILAPHQMEALKAMWRMQRALAERVGAVEIDPVTSKAWDTSAFSME